MGKWVALWTVCIVCLMLQAVQQDEEMALQSLYQAKNAINRAAHAAAQQIDIDRFKYGQYWIDEQMAESTAKLYLQHNLYLDENLQALPDTFWQSRVQIVLFEVINADRTFPFVYDHEELSLSVMLEGPGVILVVELEYPRTFSLIAPFHWTLKGVAELHRAV